MKKNVTSMRRRVLEALHSSFSPFTRVIKKDDNLILTTWHTKQYLIEICAGKRSDTDIYAKFNQGIVLVPKLGNTHGIRNIIRAVIHRIEQYKLYEAKLHAARVEKVGQIQERIRFKGANPSTFERNFFGLTSTDYYLSMSPHDLAKMTIERLFTREFQQQAYRWDPSNPSTDLAKKLYKFLQSLVVPADADRLEFYCLLASEADWGDPKADLAITFKGRPEVAWVDLTSRGSKEQKEGSSTLILQIFDLYTDEGLTDFAEKVLSILCDDD